MDDHVCRILLSVRNSFSNILDSNGNYQFTMNEGIFSNYCTSNTCSSNLEKINAGCLYLFDAFFKDSSVFESVAKSNINIVEYIMIWLSYMLNLIKNEQDNSLEYFYNTYIKGDHNYKKSIVNTTGYSNYKELIEKKNLMNMNIKDISKLYDAFTKLCMMHLEFDKKNPNCAKYLKEAKEFVEKYKKLKDDSNINEKSSYAQLLSTLLNDYNNFINKCSGVNCTNLPPLVTIEEIQSSAQSSGHSSGHNSVHSSGHNSVHSSGHSSGHSSVHNSGQISEQISGQISEDPSSSSIGNKLFTVLSIFGAIAFFLGISYKYSLFGFRKRAQKQYLREKIKNIKKRMNH
ncbi:BIR protein [Plasmodium berghei]|uniref:BIR protein n=2 Tax=Plasmodium berghei TaxID=5821 RepID=A0A509AGQ1_PLABA|nr:BIR protein [Plasmodium berghei ANKA]CXH20729.1 BIR protein [Plasmodium berghei]SBW38323.1 BIR protein [Plasmodium berghei]SCL86243.1 BIR protein [Plasmodium berghei]SCL86356.1 BIR protein [Plasmodium berghei]VUC54672.1 BIR protein [Plasmodium berghei ANKA]|eukprot:XP_034420499.1 BIR protein [Plasmodium berghei ANKA]